MNQQYLIGVDFGTDSVRTMIVDSADGKKIASSFYAYPRWAQGLYCDPASQQYRQHPLDHLEGLEGTIKDCLLKASIDPKAIKAISIASTGSTPCAVNAAGVPLALTEGMQENPNAMFVLWKDHTAQHEANEINAHAKKFEVDYLAHSGGVYSAEWFWAKWLHVMREDDSLLSNAVSFVEHCDWIPFLLTGGTDVRQMKRGVCAAGHKALWCGKGLPPREFFTSLDLRFHDKLFFDKVYTSDQSAGMLCKEWAEKLGLHTGIVVGVGALDAHMGAVGSGIQPKQLCKVMGTSTCDMLVAGEAPLVRGICGQVEGSIIPGMVGTEAGQSAFGDLFAWYRDLLLWPMSLVRDQTLRGRMEDQLLVELSRAANDLPLHVDDPVAVDWLNGRRTPDANQSLTGAISGLSLGSSAPQIFKAIVESACFGARAINECFTSQGVAIEEVVALGGIAQKSPYVMQVLADVLQMPIKVSAAEQACALGAAMFAAAAAGVYPDVQTAMRALGQGYSKEFRPDADKADYYEARYCRYLELGKFIETKSKPTKAGRLGCGMMSDRNAK